MRNASLVSLLTLLMVNALTVTSMRIRSDAFNAKRLEMDQQHVKNVPRDTDLTKRKIIVTHVKLRTVLLVMKELINVHHVLVDLCSIVKIRIVSIVAWTFIIARNAKDWIMDNKYA